MINRLTPVIFFLLGAVAIANVQEAYAQTLIYVDPANSQSSDYNPGTQTLPVRTLKKAAALVVEYNRNWTSTKVLVAPGTYRENLEIVYDSRPTSASITYESTTKGAAIVAGSDVWTGWAWESGSIYRKSWPYRWGSAGNPTNWQNLASLPTLLRRREMIFINGVALRAVDSYGALAAGTFFVSESWGLVYIWAPSGTNMSTAKIEVAVREHPLQVRGRQNVTIRGFVFQHANTIAEEAAGEISDASSVLLEDNQFIWNAWCGLGVLAANYVTLRRNIASNNGVVGMQSWKLKNFLAEDNQTSYNNWRGAQNGFYGWAAAGMKNAQVHSGVFRRQKVIGNYSGGFWLDTDCKNITLESSFLNDNRGWGLFLEANQGPIRVENNAICRNKTTHGIFVANTKNVTLNANTIYGNGGSLGNMSGQLGISGEYNGSRQIQDWETGQTLDLMSENWTMTNNTIVGLNSKQMDIFTTVSPYVWNTFAYSLSSSYNLWYSYSTKYSYLMPNYIFIDFPNWQRQTGKDSNSWYVSPEQAGVPIYCD